MLFQEYKEYSKYKADFKYRHMDRICDGWNDWEDEFEREYKPNPLILFNKVLEKYSCNGYYFDAAEDPDNANVLIPTSVNSEEYHKVIIAPKLKKTGMSDLRDVGDLSSGEKTLLAMASVLSNYNED